MTDTVIPLAAALDVSGPGGVLPVAAAGVLVLMVATWALGLKLKDVSIVDVSWGLAFVTIAWAAFAVGDGDDGRRLLLALLVSAWGLRLAGYIAWRKTKESGEDKRYVAMREKHGDRFPVVSLYTIFGLQGLLALIVALPVMVAAQRPDGLDALIVPGLALWALGLFFEAVGDAQLARFKADPGNKGQVMDRGLWRYTRHPNYFGDFCVWWGIWLVALPAGGTWWTFIGPVVMSVLLIRVSGAGLLEKTVVDRRPGYREYIERTSGFVPMPPRKG